MATLHKTLKKALDARAGREAAHLARLTAAATKRALQANLDQGVRDAATMPQNTRTPPS